MATIRSLITTMLMLIALYLVLRFGANASRVIGAFAKGLGEVFTTLQARNVPARGRRAA